MMEELPCGDIETRTERAAAHGRNTPFNASCPTCEHSWAVLYLPMELEKAAALMTAARCPKGCSASPRLGSSS